MTDHDLARHKSWSCLRQEIEQPAPTRCEAIRPRGVWLRIISRHRGFRQQMPSMGDITDPESNRINTDTVRRKRQSAIERVICPVRRRRWSTPNQDASDAPAVELRLIIEPT
jgi:hypothetical protein